MSGALRFLSVCSGMEAASAAWEPLGFSPVAFSEIDPAASAFLEQKFPSVPNWGDMTQFGEWPDAAIDILVGGTPCQSFSVSGLREGLRDPRGNLALVYLALARRYRPRWLVWENVAGVLSTNRGRDFGSFLGALGQLGYGFAYRVLDAQYWGVPQRRRRVFLVGYLGDWRRPGAVLFERASVSGNAPPVREIRETDFAGSRRRVAVRDRAGRELDLIAHDAVATLDAGYGRLYGCSGQDVGHDYSHVVAFHHRQDALVSGDVTFPLGARDDGLGVLIRRAGGGYSVRRLMPVECLRLQGFPDDWFDGISFRGRLLTDRHKYRMIGNSIAVPVMRWIGERIQLVDGIEVEP